MTQAVEENVPHQPAYIGFTKPTPAFVDFNPALNTDSYKVHHRKMAPLGTDNSFYYLAPRTTGEEINFFGLQALVMHNFMNPTTKEHVDEAAELLPLHIPGQLFDREPWDYLINKHGGYWPLRIRALQEGCTFQSGLPLFTVEATDPYLFHLPGYLEPQLERVWAAITAGSKSRRCHKIIMKYLELTCDEPEKEINFKLHDFGARAATGQDGAGLVGAAHLQFFFGTDTIDGLRTARKYYGATCAGYTIPATEHSITTALGRKGELTIYRNLVDLFAKEGAIFACVSDGFDYFKAVREYWGGELREQIMNSGATLVIRPDSGKAVEVVPATLEILWDKFGGTTSHKGYKVLNPCVRVIQGDGVEETAIDEILAAVVAAGFSAENVSFGMGGELHQKMNRDTHKIAYKNSAQSRFGEWHDCYKEPVTDPGKTSLRGRVSVYSSPLDGPVCMTHSQWRAQPVGVKMQMPELMEDVYLNGEMKRVMTFDQIRANALSSF